MNNKDADYPLKLRDLVIVIHVAVSRIFARIIAAKLKNYIHEKVPNDAIWGNKHMVCSFMVSAVFCGNHLNTRANWNVDFRRC